MLPDSSGEALASASHLRRPHCHSAIKTWSGGAGEETRLSLLLQSGFYSLSEQLTWKMMTKARRADRMAQYCLENSYGFGAHGGSR